MKRTHAWPKEIVEVKAPGVDPRAADAQATQKISRAQLDAVLKRTSGTRPAVRSEHDASHASNASDASGAHDVFDAHPADATLPGPRDSFAELPESFAAPQDDGPHVTIMGIHSMEFPAIDPSSLQPRSPVLTPPRESHVSSLVPATSPVDEFDAIDVIDEGDDDASGIQLTRKQALVLSIAFFAFVSLATFVGFLVGRISVH